MTGGGPNTVATAGATPPRRRRWAALGTFLALVAPTLLGCGGEDDGERAAVVQAGGSVTVIGREYTFEPEQVVVRGGGAGGDASVEAVLRNAGSLAHNLTVLQGERKVAGTRTIVGGKRSSARFSLAPGEYRFVCTVDGHEERGMVGTLEVR